MSWDREHGCTMPGRVGHAVHAGDPLTVDEIRKLRTGRRVVITWSGGNGPHSYTIRTRHGLPCAENEDGLPGTSLIQWPDQRAPINRVTLA